MLLWLTAFTIAQFLECQVTARPNIVLIVADDLDLELNGTFPLSKTRKLIAGQGANFTNMYVTNPLSCPSRASILSGMYPHNHRVINNSVQGGCSDHNWRQLEKLTLGSLLQKESYTTCFVGSYLDEYGLSNASGGYYVPLGWSSWKALVGKSAYYNYKVFDNGEIKVHDDQYAADYFTDYVKNASIEFIQGKPSDPFFLFIAPPACSPPFTPAPQFKSMFAKQKAPRTKSYGATGKVVNTLCLKYSSMHDDEAGVN